MSTHDRDKKKDRLADRRSRPPKGAPPGASGTRFVDVKEIDVRSDPDVRRERVCAALDTLEAALHEALAAVAAARRAL